MKNQKVFIFFYNIIRKTFFRLTGLVCILVIGTMLSFFYWLHYLPQEYSGENAEAIIVLTGASGRLSAGAQLLKDKKAEVLFISGVNAKLSDRILFKQMPLLDKNLKKYAFTGRKAKNTVGNALEAKEWMEANNYQSAIIVTSDWHMARAMLEFTNIMKDKTFIAYPVVTNELLEKAKYKDLSKDLLFLLFKEYCKLNMRKLQLKLTPK